MTQKHKRINYRHWISLALLLGSVALCIFVYEYPLLRLIESGEAFGRSIAQTFLDAFGLSDGDPITQTVNEYSRVDLFTATGIDLPALRNKFTGVWSQLFVWTHFRAYLLFLLWEFVQILYYVDIVFIACLPIIIYVIATWETKNNDHNRETRPLRLFKFIIATPLCYVTRWCKSFWHFFHNSAYWKIFLVIWTINLGIISVALSFLAYYFYILNAFDLSSIGVQLLKLAADLLLALNTLPWYCWVALGVWLFDRWRLAHAEDKM